MAQINLHTLYSGQNSSAPHSTNKGGTKLPSGSPCSLEVPKMWIGSFLLSVARI